jgi:Protein of unknown function (DUF3486)
VGRTSKIKASPAIQAAVDSAIKRGCTIDAIKDMLDQMGAEIGRSAVGNYTKRYAAVAQRQRDIRSAADAFAGEFGEAGDNQTRLMIQLVTTLITENILAKGEGEGSAMDLRLLAGAVKDAIGAAKLDDDRRRLIRKEAFKEAAEVADKAGRANGAGEASLQAIRAALMGVTA